MGRHIPIRLLSQDCVLKRKTGADRNRTPVYEETVLKHVRIGATFQTTRGNAGETKADTMTLIIDAEHTCYEMPDGEEAEAVIPAELDAVWWNGKKYTVRSVTPCYAQGNGPHHWEVTLE